jgi:antitoxin PrlF
MPAATMTSKGQITIPKEIRDALGLEVGDKVDFIQDATGVVILRPATRRVASLAGLLERPGQRVRSLTEMDAAVRRRGGAT